MVSVPDLFKMEIRRLWIDEQGEYIGFKEFQK